MFLVLLKTQAFLDLSWTLKKTILTRFDGVDKELLNLKDVFIKNLQIENQRLRSKVDNLEKKVISLEENGNLLEQYGRRNNLEITGISNEIEGVDLEGKVIEILDKIEVNVSSKDIEWKVLESQNTTPRKRSYASSTGNMQRKLFLTERT